MKNSFCILLLFFVCFISLAQEVEGYLNFSILGDVNVVNNNGAVAMGIGYEWLPINELGFELGAKGGFGAYESSSTELDNNLNIIGETKNRVVCNFELINFIPRGYLSISDKNHKVYLGLPLALYFIQAKGTISTYDVKTFKTKQGYAPKLSVGLELGICGSVSETIDGKVFLGGNNINFERAINQLDFEGVGAENILSLNTNGIKFGVVFSFHSTK